MGGTEHGLRTNVFSLACPVCDATARPDVSSCQPKAG